MSKHISVRSFSFIAAEDHLSRLSVTPGEVASVEPGLVVTQSQRALMPATVAMPVWCGTLPGVMAGKRPAQSRPVLSVGVPFSGRAA